MSDSDDKDRNLAPGSFEETRRWQLKQFAKLSVDEKFKFLQDGLDLMRIVEQNKKKKKS